MHELISAYIADKKDSLDALYQWKFDEALPKAKFGIVPVGENWFQKTLSLKQQLQAYIHHHPEARSAVANYFIRDWGGIQTFKRADAVVSQFATVEAGGRCPDGFSPKLEGISSWSKWLSLVCPQWACIYDARVAYSLNGINYLHGGKHPIFPMPQGRNGRLVMIDVPTLIVGQALSASHSSQPAAIRKTLFVDARSAYLVYLQTLTQVSQQLWGDTDHIHEVEMLLFVLADGQIYQDVFTKLTTKEEV